ncbi:MAG: hypothetical protein WC300_05505, partial [Candidatus Omnitrophota bacterium]
DIVMPNNEIDLYSAFTRSAGKGIKVSVDDKGNFVITGVGENEEDMALSDFIKAGTTDAVNILKELVKDNPELQKLLDAIVSAAKYGSGAGVVIRRVNRNDIGSIADKDINLKVSFDGEDTNGLVTIELSDQWARTISDMMSLDTSKGKRAASYLIFETLVHELSHTDDISKPFQQLAEELRNYTGIDRNLEKILYGIPELKDDVSTLIRKAGPMTGKTGLAGHIRDFTEKDPVTGERTLIDDWKLIIDNITNSLVERGSDKGKRPLPSDIMLIEENDMLRNDIALTVENEMNKERPDLIGLKNEIYVLINRAAIIRRVDELKKNKDELDALGIDINNLILKANQDLSPADLSTLQKEVSNIEARLTNSVPPRTEKAASPAGIGIGKKSSAGIVNVDNILSGLDTDFAARISGILKDNNIDLTSVSYEYGYGFAGLGITAAGGRIQIPALLIEALGLFGNNGAEFLGSLLTGLRAAGSGNSPFRAQADYLGVTIEQVNGLYEDLGRVMANLDSLKLQIIDIRQRQEISAAVFKAIDVYRQRGGTIEDLKRDLLDSISGMEGLPAGIADKLMLGPIYGIMNQVIKPRMSQFEVAGELTPDTALAISRLVNAALTRPQYLKVSTGNVLIFEANTVTESLAITLGAIINKMPRAQQEMITVAVYGYNSYDAIRLFASYGVNAKPLEALEGVNTATVIYSNPDEMVNIDAEHIRYIEVEGALGTANNMVTASQIIFAVFHMPLKEFAENLKDSGIDIGISDAEMQYIFANTDSIEGVIKIKPVDSDTIKRISSMISQAV